jgi:transcriptional regulator with XRE-family HTH domain
MMARTLADALAKGQAHALLAFAKVGRMKVDPDDAARRRARLKQLCDARSQSVISELTGISLSQLGQWLTGERNMTDSSAKNIARKVGLLKDHFERPDSNGARPYGVAFALATLERSLTGLSVEGRQSVGLLLAAWAADPSAKRDTAKMIETLLGPAVGDAHVGRTIRPAPTEKR